MPKVKKQENMNKSQEIDMKKFPISDESLSLFSRIGQSCNYMNLSRFTPDEITLDFIRVSVSEQKVHKDLVARVNLSLANTKALRDLLNSQITD